MYECAFAEHHQSRPMKRRELPPQLYFVTSAVFHYLGPSFAVLLFARVAVLGVAWLRIASAAVVFALWRKPWRAARMASRCACCTGPRGANPKARSAPPICDDWP